MKVKTQAFLIVFLTIMFLFGCTSEKAEALITAIKSFEAKSLQAIAAYEQMFKGYKTIERETNNELFEQSVAVIDAGSASTVNLDSMVAAISLRDAYKVDSTIEKEFYDIKIVYASIRKSYESLPRGSVLGSNYVKCGQVVVAKATSQLVNFSLDIDKSPLYPISLRQKIAKYKKLVKEHNVNEARSLFNEIASDINNYDELHKNAEKLTLAAVEEGRRVHQLLNEYGDMSASEILEVVQFGLDFLETLKGIDADDVRANLQSVKNEIDNNEYWKRITELPVSDIGNCKSQLLSSEG